jgi:hypothetical protein
MVSFRLQSEEFEGAQAAGTVPSEVSSGVGIVCMPGAVKDADDQVVDGCQEARRAAGADPARVFAVGRVTPVVQAVLYAPVVTVMGEQAGRAGLAGGQAGDPVTVSHDTFAPSWRPQPKRACPASWPPARQALMSPMAAVRACR